MFEPVAAVLQQLQVAGVEVFPLEHRLVQHLGDLGPREPEGLAAAFADHLIGAGDALAEFPERLAHERTVEDAGATDALAFHEHGAQAEVDRAHGRGIARMSATDHAKVEVFHGVKWRVHTSSGANGS